jgi:hypothetical protein
VKLFSEEKIMTEIFASVAKPVNIITSDLYRATKSIRFGIADVGIVPQADGTMCVELKSRSRDKAWAAYSDFKAAYPAEILKLIEKNPRRTVECSLD